MAWFVPALMAASTAMTIMGHRQNIKHEANAAWKRYENTLQLEYDKQNCLKTSKIFSEKRARVGARVYNLQVHHYYCKS